MVGPKEQDFWLRINIKCKKIKKLNKENASMNDGSSKIDIQNWLWKYNFGTFWQTVITCRNFLMIFPWWHVDSWPKNLLFRTHHLWNSTTELILLHIKTILKLCLLPYTDQKWILTFHICYQNILFVGSGEKKKIQVVCTLYL